MNDAMPFLLLAIGAMLSVIGFLIVFVLNGIKGEISDIKGQLTKIEGDLHARVTEIDRRLTDKHTEIDRRVTTVEAHCPAACGQ
jgi:hypothetical protein